jgi:hypothetical protein
VTRVFVMPQRLAHTGKPGEMLKQPLSLVRLERKDMNGSEPTHLKLIRQCPCLNCGTEPCEAAHVRMSSAAHGKTNARGKKPADCWTVPLCPDCHTRDPQSQHRIGELTFWHRVGMNPLIVAKQLHEATGDLPKMRAICFNAIAERESGEQSRP